MTLPVIFPDRARAVVRLLSRGLSLTLANNVATLARMALPLKLQFRICQPCESRVLLTVKGPETLAS